MFENIKKLFKKEERYPCIVWDGKKMSYPSLTQKEIDEINNAPKYEGWFARLKDDKEDLK